MTNAVLEVNRNDHAETRIAGDESTPLDEGQVRLRIDRFAVTANNVTYAVAGDMLGYWDFFPAEEPWGRVPAMGWADVVESRNDDIEVGGRYYGWFPMAAEIVFDATATADGFRDDGAHRAKHAPVYRSYVSTERDPWYEAGDDAEDRHALLRGLFLTGFLADEFFADELYAAVDQVIVLSASSKTAIGFAQRAAQRDGVAVVGVTSTANVELVESLGYYDTVVTYDDLKALDTAASVLIDMSGNSGVVAGVHEHLGDLLRYSMALGKSHHDSEPAVVSAGPSQQMFFAPSEVTRRLDQWGRAEYAARMTEALRSFVEGSVSWLSVERTHGADAAEATWAAVRNGEVAPSVGRIVSLHHLDAG